MATQIVRSRRGDPSGAGAMPASEERLLSQISREILALLPPDGTAMPNRAVRALVSKRLGRSISNEDYDAAREDLIQGRMIGRVRGQGGSVYLLNEPAVEPAPVTPPDRGNNGSRSPGESSGILEKDLMFATGRALAIKFPAELDLPSGSPQPVVQDISTTGPKTGIWARPDFVLVSVSRYTILPGAHIDTHVFELKNEAGGGVRAVHEALAQSRYANFAHLIWLVPNGSPRENELSAIEEHCELHGVGLIRMRLLPGGDADLETLVVAKRTPTTALEVDGFLEARLTQASKESLAKAITDSRPQ